MEEGRKPCSAFQASSGLRVGAAPEGEQTLILHSCSPTHCFPCFRYHLFPRDRQVLLSQEKWLWVGDRGKMLGLLPVSLPAFILFPIRQALTLPSCYLSSSTFPRGCVNIAAQTDLCRQMQTKEGEQEEGRYLVALAFTSRPHFSLVGC